MSEHGGHRARLREKFKNGGIKALTHAQILELMLFYTVPRRDTLPIAERLLECFGSLSGVFSADISQLTRVQGVSLSSAVLIKAAADIYIEYAEPDYIGKISAEYPETIDMLLKSYAKVVKNDTILAVFINNEGFAARIERCAADNSAVEKISSAAKEYGFKKAVIAFCEGYRRGGGNGNYRPDKLAALKEAAEAVGVEVAKAHFFKRQDM